MGQVIDKIIDSSIVLEMKNTQLGFRFGAFPSRLAYEVKIHGYNALV